MQQGVNKGCYVKAKVTTTNMSEEVQQPPSTGALSVIKYKELKQHEVSRTKIKVANRVRQE